MSENHDRGNKRWLSTLDAAQILDTSIRTVERWRSEGKFAPDKRTSGGHSRYSRERVEEMKKKLQTEILNERKTRNSTGRSPHSLGQCAKMKEKQKAKIFARPMPHPSFNLPTHEEFVEYVYACLESSGIKCSMFGRKYLSDSAAISRLKSTNLTLSTMHKICAGIEEIRKNKDKELQEMLQDMME